MRYILLMIAVVALVGCGKKESPVITPDPPLPPQLFKALNKPDGDLTDEAHHHLPKMNLGGKGLTNLNFLFKCTEAVELDLRDNPAIIKAQIDELQKALPKCKIIHNATKQLNSTLPVKIPQRLGNLDARPEQRGFFSP